MIFPPTHDEEVTEIVKGWMREMDIMECIRRKAYAEADQTREHVLHYLMPWDTTFVGVWGKLIMQSLEHVDWVDIHRECNHKGMDGWK